MINCNIKLVLPLCYEFLILFFEERLIMSDELFEFNSAVCGNHFKKGWQPVINQGLACAHEVDNPCDYFPIKTYTRGSASRTVVHLPMKISRPTKYILQRGALIVATLLSTNYRRSTLVQGGLEVSYRVAVFIAKTVENKEVIQKYKDMVDVVYAELDGSVVVGSFAPHYVSMQLNYRKKGSQRTNTALT